jgi:hypothetical protein
VFLLVRSVLSGSLARVPIRPRLAVPVAAVVVVLAVLAAVTPHVWTLPILSAASLVSTALVAVTALSWMRAEEPAPFRGDVADGGPAAQAGGRPAHRDRSASLA